MAIKVSLGRLTAPLPFTDLVAEHVYGNAVELLGIAPRHLDVLTTLPFYHKHPFDRLIIAQGQAEDIPILSRDPALAHYAIRQLLTWQPSSPRTRRSTTAPGFGSDRAKPARATAPIVKAPRSGDKHSPRLTAFCRFFHVCDTGEKPSGRMRGERARGIRAA